MFNSGLFNSRLFKLGNTKAVLLTIFSSLLLVSQTMTLQAEPVETSAQVSEKVAKTQSDGHQKAEITREVRRGFPRRPERQKISRSTVPPPPPGPYMSTALSEPARGVSFERNRVIKESGRRVESQEEPIASSNSKVRSNSNSMDRFSPDRPWPSNLRPPNRWEPENGYQYVGVQGNNYSTIPRPEMRRPESRQIAPSIGSMPDPRARHRATSPGYQGYNAGYYNPAYRSPYPAQGRP